MTQMADVVATRKIIAEFRAFKKTYDRYLDRIDELLSQMDHQSELYKKARFFVPGTDYVTMFTLHGEDKVTVIGDILMRGGG